MQSESRSFNYSVNGFRGLCVLLVFVYHVVNSGLIPKPPYESLAASVLFFVGSSCRYGVELFFMISGYVIVNSLRRHASIGRFLWDRFARIFPVWVPVHVGLFAIGLVTGWRSFSALTGADLLSVFVANLLLIPPLLHWPQTHDGSWSLTYEWLFYLIAAAATLTQLRDGWRRHASRCLLAVFTIVLLCLLPRGLFFIPGVLLGLNWIPLQKITPTLKYPLFAVWVFLLAWRGVGLDEARPGAYSPATLLMGWSWLLTVVSLLAALYAFACVCVDGSNTAWLRRRAMQQLGNMSYSFYLWHPIVMFSTKRVTYAWIVPHVGTVLGVLFFAVTSFVLAFAVSHLSYRLLEVRIGKALRQWLGPTSSTPRAASPVLQASQMGET